MKNKHFQLSGFLFLWAGTNAQAEETKYILSEVDYSHETTTFMGLD